jgi:hypothetical protein
MVKSNPNLTFVQRGDMLDEIARAQRWATVSRYVTENSVRLELGLPKMLAYVYDHVDGYLAKQPIATLSNDVLTHPASNKTAWVSYR